MWSQLVRLKQDKNITFFLDILYNIKPNNLGIDFSLALAENRELSHKVDQNSMYISRLAI